MPKLNKVFIEKIPLPEKDKVFYRDEQLKGFGLVVRSSGRKTFIVEKRINRKVKRISLGIFGELSPESARKKALALLGEIAMGGDPLARSKEDKAKLVTLGQVYEDYLNTRKSLKPTTLKGYERVIKFALADWVNQPLLSITKDKIASRHTKLGEEKGEAWANLTMRVLRALFNFAAAQYEDSQGRSLIIENPVKKLSTTKAWYRVVPRKGVIKNNELSSWFKAVSQITNEITRDYLILILFTGLRRKEAANLKWVEVDFDAKTLFIPDPKNSEPHTLPLSDYLFYLLKQRKINNSSEYVFPGSGKSGHIEEPKRQIKKIIEESGVQFTIHDERRTFVTIAESLDISAYAVKQLVNHKISNDVTEGYIVKNVERLREPMQKITDFIVTTAEINKII